MATFKLNEIQFTADNTSMLKDGQRTVKFGNVENGDFSEASEYGVVPFVNAVEIDWNSAKLGSTTINTTGELLSYISGVANNIPEVPADVITESKLSAKGYLTSSDLDVSYQNVRDWVTTNFVEKPTVTKIVAGVLTSNEKINLSSVNLRQLINDKIAVNLHKDSWDYTKPFNVGYLSTNNIDVDGNLYGTVKCTTKTSGYLYLVTVQPISSDVMGDELPSAAYLSPFTYISSNTLPTSIGKDNINNYTGAEFFAYLKKNDTSLTVDSLWLADESTTIRTYNMRAGLTIVDYGVYISQGTFLNIYTKVGSSEPISTPTPTVTVTVTPTATPE